LTAIYRRNGYCPVCEKAAVFSAEFDWYRDHLRCETCGSIPRERAAALVLSRHRGNWRDLAIHESSPEPRGISLKLQRECTRYTASNLFPGRALGVVVDGFRNENLEAQTFESASFDVVVAMDVLEHVNRPDDALAEIARTLKPGGCLIFTAPTYKDRVTSERRARYLEDGTVEHLAEPEYHGNPISDKGSLVTFHYGYDLARAAFEWSGLDVEVSRFHDHHMGLIGEFTEVYVATKNLEGDRPPIDVTPDVGSFADFEMPATTQISAPALGRVATLGVPADVHPEDQIFQFIWNSPTSADKDEALRYRGGSANLDSGLSGVSA
jgi:SAM-dependent methyltransferase